MPRGVYDRGPAQRGKRVPLLPDEPVPVGPATYVCGHKPLLVGARILYQGVEVPDAENWPRIEAWVSARRIRRLDPDVPFIAYDDFCKEWDSKNGVQDELPLEFQGDAKLQENLELVSKG